MIQHKNTALEIQFQDSGSKSFLAAVNLHQTAVIFFSFSKNFFLTKKLDPETDESVKFPNLSLMVFIPWQLSR